tara:strand:- start:2243 stop:2467 length:225 start_codon:yes stop_codon:yes gene_type:complete
MREQIEQLNKMIAIAISIQRQMDRIKTTEELIEKGISDQFTPTLHDTLDIQKDRLKQLKIDYNRARYYLKNYAI